MTEKSKSTRSTPAATQAVCPFDFANVVSEFDLDKVMDRFAKLLTQYQFPGMDVRAVLESNTKNLETWTTANKLAMKGIQTLVADQGEILRHTLDEADAAIRDNSEDASPTDIATEQLDSLKHAMETALTKMGELTEIKTKTLTGDILSDQPAEHAESG